MLTLKPLDEGAPRNSAAYRARASLVDFRAIPPAQYVKQILGEETDGSSQPSHPSLFVELAELIIVPNGTEWKETARWVKFEENVEVGGNRWSKPHVGTLSLHSLFEIRNILLNNVVILNLNGSDFEEIVDQILDQMVNTRHLHSKLVDKVKETLLRPHRHQNQQIKGKSSSDAKDHGDKKTKRGIKSNAFMKKIPVGAEACIILVGEVDFLEKPLSAFVRLSEAVIMENLTEVPSPTRFIFILLGPIGGVRQYHDVGRAMATLLSDEVFHDVAYLARHRGHLMAGTDEFLDAVTIIPPAKWDPNIRIEPPPMIPSQDPRKYAEQIKVVEMSEEEERASNGLVRTGKLFGGLINDFKRKVPWYLSDYKDGLAAQCIASSIFLYLGCLTPIITFGGLLGKVTHQNMAAMESLVSGFACGLIYGLFSGQPLTILGSTGPVLVFEAVIVQFCDAYEMDYLELRLWIGVWMGFILLLMVALDASAFVCYITRFTEESFATLIAIIFIVEAFKNVNEIRHLFPINPHGENANGSSCECKPQNTSSSDNDIEWSLVDFDQCTKAPYNGTLVGRGCGYYSDIYLMSVLLFLGTFFIAVSLKNFKMSSYFPTKVRQVLADFAVLLAIIAMTCVDLLVGLRTPKLSVPEKFAPTLPSRSWFVSPFGKNPFWTVFAALLPALLATILIFMDQQITAVIVNRKEHKLKKGCGYHLDLLVLSVLIIMCSLFGVPWFVAATVQALNHVESLKMESSCAAPGERPKFLGIREQRVTQVAIAILTGLSVVITPVLKHIPMPVLYGVFLYMGLMGLNGMQFFDRILLIFMPAKYQPDYEYLREVPLRRVHLFTAIQLACLVLLWLVKSFRMTSILFPLMLVVIILVRKPLDYLFSQRELKSLDHLMPNSKKEEKDEESNTEANLKELQMAGMMMTRRGSSIPLVLKRNSVNITEELQKTGIWKQIENNNSPELFNGKGSGVNIRGSTRDAATEEERKHLTVMEDVVEPDDANSKQ